MTPQKQKNLHDPANGVFGDCYRTCLAVMLDLDRDEVPHFVTTLEQGAWERDIQPQYDAWLHERGVVEVTICYDCEPEDVLAVQASLNPNTYYMMTAKSKTGVGHCVVCCGGEIVCDPSLNDSGIVGRHPEGYVWIAFLTPTAMIRSAA